MLHHISLGAHQFDRTARFYDAVLAPLGFVRVWTVERPEGRAVGYGLPNGGDQLAIKEVRAEIPSIPGFHLAFTASGPHAVRAFYEAALAHGGADHGEPGFRPHYGPNYYAAFVLDPEGHRLEAVCNGHAPEGKEPP